MHSKNQAGFVLEIGHPVTLTDHAFLKGLSESVIESLESCTRPYEFPAGTYLGRQGDEVSQFYLIRSGRVGVELMIPHQGPMRIDTVGAQEALGWSWLVPPYRWHFDARAVTDVRAWGVGAGCLRAKIDQDHELGFQLMNRIAPLIAKRLHAAELKLLVL